MTGQPQPHPLPKYFLLTGEEIKEIYSETDWAVRNGLLLKAMSLISDREKEVCASHTTAGAQQRIEHNGKLFIEVDHGKVKCTDGKYHDFHEHFYLFDVTTGDTIALLRAGDQHE